MTQIEYIQNLGFFENPFLRTNADNEKDYLTEYFVYPEYFDDVWGNPADPASTIVYAPRGCGKTAQRLIIESKSKDYDYLLSVSYTEHDLSNYKSVEDINISYHLENLNRLLLNSFLNELFNTENGKIKCSFNLRDRQFLYKLCRIYLYNTPISYPKSSIKKLKTFIDKIIDFWRAFKTPISNLIKSISKTQGVEIDISEIKTDSNRKNSHRKNFFDIKEYLNRIGKKSIYILIDKVDEQNLTGNNPEASYKFISSLIKDLELLETPGIGFKFFLWDKLKPFCSVDARPDRIYSYNFNWTFEQLLNMFNKRIAIYSDKKVSDGASLFEIDMTSLQNSRPLGRIVVFAEFSPRDFLRICNRVLSEQYKSDKNSKQFTNKVVNDSIDLFIQERVRELIIDDNILSYIRKFNAVSFLEEEILLNETTFNREFLSNLINTLQKAEFIKIIGKRFSKENKQAYEYAFTDNRLARYSCLLIRLDSFIEQKIRDCKNPNCKVFAYRDFNRNTYNCIECGTTLNND